MGCRVGIASLLINTFKAALLRIGLIFNFVFQIEIYLNYLYPLLFFCKKHSLCRFLFLMDLICFEFLNSIYRYVFLIILFKINVLNPMLCGI